jgi:GGDEF domain-containing protein
MNALVAEDDATSIGAFLRYGRAIWRRRVSGCFEQVRSVHGYSRAESLRAAICAKPTMTATTPVRVSISIGLALSLDFPNSSVAVGLHEADKALYPAKNAGRNCVRLAQHPVQISGTGMEITGAHATS